MALQLRPPHDSTDYAAISAILTATGANAADPRQLQHDDLPVAPPALRRRMLAVTPEQRVVGTSSLRRGPWTPDGQLVVSIAVAPELQHTGIGSALFADVLAYATRWGATMLVTVIDDQTPQVRHFAEQRGFGLRQHWVSWRLQLATFQEAPFIPALTEAADRGIRFSSFAEAPATETAQQQLYALNRRTSLDAPGEDSFPPFDAFVRDILHAPWFRADGQILAVDGERWIGLAAVGIAGSQAFQAFTGVDRAYRRQGIAQALTVLSIRYARRHGANALDVENDSRNTAMIAMQTKLGYARIPGRYIMQRRLA